MCDPGRDAQSEKWHVLGNQQGLSQVCRTHDRTDVNFWTLIAGLWLLWGELCWSLSLQSSEGDDLETAFKEVMKVNWGHMGGPSSHTWHPYKRSARQQHRLKGNHWRARWEGSLLKAQGRSLKKNLNPLTPWSWISTFQKCEQIKCPLFIPSSG